MKSPDFYPDFESEFLALHAERITPMPTPLSLGDRVRLKDRNFCTQPDLVSQIMPSGHVRLRGSGCKEFAAADLVKVGRAGWLTRLMLWAQQS